MTFSVPKTNTGKCYIILAGTTVLSGGPNWEKYLRE